MEFAAIASVVSVANVTIAHLIVLKKHLKSSWKMRTLLSGCHAKMESLVAYLKKLVDEQKSNRVSVDILVRGRNELDDINGKLDKLLGKFTGQYRWFWNIPSFVLASSIHDDLRDIAAAIETWYKHLETSHLGFRSIEMQSNIQESINEVKILVVSGRAPRLDASITPYMVPVYMIHFKVTMVLKELLSIPVGNTTITNRIVLTEHLNACWKLRSAVCESLSSIELLVFLLMKLEDEKPDNQISVNKIGRAKVKLDAINVKLDKLHYKLTVVSCRPSPYCRDF